MFECTSKSVTDDHKCASFATIAILTATTIPGPFVNFWKKLSLLINLVSFPTKSLNNFFIIKLKPFTFGEKVKGEKVCGSSAEGSTHHRCTSGPKKGRAHYFKEGVHIFRRGGGVCKRYYIDKYSFFKPFRNSERLYNTVKSP